MRPMQKTIVLGLAAALALLGGAVAANAELRVTGTAADMVVHAESATLADVLAGLAAACHAPIEVKGATTRQFTGSYSGSLPKVLSRLLVGINHVVHVAPDRVTIVLVTPDTAPRTAQSYGGSSSVQGWVPPAREAAAPATRPQALAVPPGPAADDMTERPSASAVQGWVPPAGQLASMAAAPRPQAAPGTAIVSDLIEEKPSGGVQGWVPTVLTAAAAQPAEPQALPIAADDGPVGGVQGWVPEAPRAN
jgi:hypothetical protein